MYYQEEDLNYYEVMKYLRKSRSDDPNMSVEEVLERHNKMLKNYAESHLGGDIPEENTFREIASSETIDDRPEMLKLLKAIESPKIKAILVVEVQRLSRGDLDDAGRLIKLLRYTNTKVITPTKTYDLRDEYDRDAFERELKRGNEYLEYYKKIQKRGKEASVEAGNFIGSIPPYGYDKTWVMDGKKKCPTLKINKEQADVVRMIFDMYVNQDMGRWHICYKLNEMGIKPPNGVKWSPESLYDMLSNVHYIGKVKWNWRKTVTVIEDQEVIHTRPKAKLGEYLLYEGKHEAIIDEELFYKAQEIKGKNPRNKPSTKIRNPIASLLYCQCGKAMTLRTYDSDKRVYKSEPRFLCINQHYCHTGSVLVSEMYDRLCEVLEQCIEDFEIRLKNNQGDSIKLHNKLIENMKKKLAELEEKELAQWEAQADPDESKRMPQHIFQKLNKKLLKEKEEINQALCNAYESMPEPVDYAEKIVTFKKALELLKNPDVDAAKKNKYLKTVIERIDYTREKTYRLTKQQIKEGKLIEGHVPKGNGWFSPPFEIDVKLKF